MMASADARSPPGSARRSGKRLPSNALGLHVAELVARALGTFRMDEIHSVPRITEKLRLPAFKWNMHNRYAGPRHTRKLPD
jgi:hypothetical protein